MGEDYVFQWNGDVYAFAGQPLDSSISDTLFMAAKLADCFAAEADESESILRCLEQVQGPWAFVFWHKNRRSLWFGRDYFGRQSLLLHRGASSVVLASCAPADDRLTMDEVAAHGIYRLQLGGNERHLFKLYPWDVTRPESGNMKTQLIVSEKRLRCPVNIEAITGRQSRPVHFTGDLDVDHVLEELLSNVEVRLLVMELIDKLRAAVKVRVENQPGRCKNCIKACFFNRLSSIA
jgi:hypothetical protein